MTLSVAVAARIDKVLSYTCEDVERPADIPTGALVSAPLGKKLITGLVLDPVPTQFGTGKGVKLRSIRSLLPSEVWLTKELVELMTWCARYYHIPLGKILSTALPNAVLEQQFGSLEHPKIWQLSSSAANDENIQQLNRAPRQSALYKWIGQQQQCTNADIKNAGFDLNLLKQLRAKDLIVEMELQNSQSCPAPSTIEKPHSLSDEQSDALKHVLTADSKRPLLLKGVTGSGKTEIYLQAAEKILQKGKQVLVLVPEIGLIPQTKERFKNRFNAAIHIYSSECSETEKLQTWCAAKTRKPAIFIGTRSTIFLPYEHLGIIVVDEEHDLSYKQQEGWRYHARDLATLRSRALKVPLVLGSATPSFESFHNAQTGIYKQLTLRRRASGVALPRIQMVPNQSSQNLSLPEESLMRIQDTLDKGAQVLVFINRRGFAPRVLCTNCGWIALCPQCDTALCKHMQPAQLICHHCDYRISNPTACPACKSSKLTTQGLGTEQLTQHLEHCFPAVECLRIDRDSTRRKGSFKQYMDRVNKGEPCILVGTQMLAKGHHLPRLSLAIICEADQALFSHDYRAKEHLGQLVTQVAGRTGREIAQGELLIQTSFPDHPFWEQLINRPYSDYAEELLAEREQNELPPYRYAAFLRAESTDIRALTTFMAIAKDAISPNQTGLEILGPMPSAIEKKNRRFRYYLSLTAARRKTLHENLSQISYQLANLKGFTKVRYSIDVDPQTFD